MSEDNLKLIIERIFSELTEIKGMVKDTNDDLRTKFENLEKRVLELEQVKRLTFSILSNGVFQKFIVFSLIGSIAYFLGHFDIISKILTLLK